MLSNSDSLTKLLSLIDLTNLDEHATNQDIENLIQKALSEKGNVAGVCVYPKFVPLVAKNLAKTDVKIITVANFPNGDDSIHDIERSIQNSIQNGAQEIDLVFPYKKYLSGQEDEALAVVKIAREISKNVTLKIILETGYFENPEEITKACEAIIPLGIDFIKTSTGKIPTGATFPAIRNIFQAIKNNPTYSVGIKISGGIHTIERARACIELVIDMMGESWLNSSHVRIGASRLVDEILK